MKTIKMKQMAFLNLLSFGISLATPSSAFAESGSSQVIEEFAYWTAQDNLSPFIVAKEMSRNLSSAKFKKELLQVFSESYLSSGAKWLKMRGKNAQILEISTKDKTYELNFTNISDNTLVIEGRSFVLNPNLSLKENAQRISKTLESKDQSSLHFVKQLFLPEAKADTLTVAAAITAVVGIGVAIWGISKYKKAKKDGDEAERLAKLAVRSKHQEYIASRQYHDHAKKDYHAALEESESVAE